MLRSGPSILVKSDLLTDRPNWEPGVRRSWWTRTADGGGRRGEPQEMPGPEAGGVCATAEVELTGVFTELLGLNTLDILKQTRPTSPQVMLLGGERNGEVFREAANDFLMQLAKKDKIKLHSCMG